jgi:nucleoside 2-deoxyribosyltransferase
MKELCNQYGFEGISPFDNAFDNENFNGELWSKERSVNIFKSNHEIVKNCDIIIANLIPFRGACIDDGTAWEIGCGYANNKVLYGYTPHSYLTLYQVTDMNYEYTSNIHDDFPQIEAFAHNCVNLMIQESIELSSGRILNTFEECLVDLKEKFLKTDDNVLDDVILNTISGFSDDLKEKIRDLLKEFD